MKVSTTFSLSNLSDGDILFGTNTIETTLSNSDLELVPDGTGLVSAFDLEIFSENISNTTNNNLALATTGQGYVKFDTTTGLVIPFGDDATQTPFFSIVSYDSSGPVIVEIDVSQYSPVAGAWVSDVIVTSGGESKTVLGATYNGVAETVSIEINSSFTVAPSASDIVTARGLIWDDDASTTLFEPQVGDSRYNTDEEYLETWNGEEWQRSAGSGADQVDGSLSETIQDIDLVCLMSVNPGFGGQSFIENTFEKVKEVKELIENKKTSCLIEIDGGVTDKNATKLISCGADVLVAGSYVFGASDPAAKIQLLKKA